MFLLCPFIKQNNREKLLLLEFQIQNEQSTLSKTLAAGSNCKINFEIDQIPLFPSPIKVN